MARAAKKKTGRKPIEVTPALCRKAQRMASKGQTEEQIAESIGIAYSTLREKKKEFSAFSAAIKKGKAKAITEIENALFEDAGEPGNTAAKIFFLKNRNPEYWKEKQEIEHSSEGLADLLEEGIKRIERMHESEQQ